MATTQPFYQICLDFNKVENNGILLKLSSDYTLKFNKYDVSDGVRINQETIECVKYEDKNWNKLTDYVPNIMNWFVVTERFKNLLQRFNIGDTQFIPMHEKTENHIFYLVNVINTIDALDLSNSIYSDQIVKQKIYRSFLMPALKCEKALGNDLFKLKGDLLPNYVSDRIKKAIKQEGITGCYFINIRLT